MTQSHIPNNCCSNRCYSCPATFFHKSGNFNYPGRFTFGVSEDPDKIEFAAKVLVTLASCCGKQAETEEDTDILHGAHERQQLPQSEQMMIDKQTKKLPPRLQRMLQSERVDVQPQHPRRRTQPTKMLINEYR